jgi:hypothetical protein
VQEKDPKLKTYAEKVNPNLRAFYYSVKTEREYSGV